MKGANRAIAKLGYDLIVRVHWQSHLELAESRQVGENTAIRLVFVVAQLRDCTYLTTNWKTNFRHSASDLQLAFWIVGVR